MTKNDEAREARQDIEPTEIEALLPWYAVGTLRRRDRQRVEAALRNDSDLARQADLVREELDETIRLNELLGAPSARVMVRLMAAIDAEALAARKRNSPRAVARWLTNLIAGFSPRTLAVAASFATLVIALQAFMLISMLTKPQGGYQIASVDGESHRRGTFAMVRFARQASAAEITKFLESYQATLVDGPKPGGLYRVRVATAALTKEELARIVLRMQQERIVEFAAPSD